MATKFDIGGKPIFAAAGYCKAALEICDNRVTVYYSLPFRVDMVRFVGIAYDNSPTALKRILIELWQIADNQITTHPPYLRAVEEITKVITDAGMAALDVEA